MPVDVTMPKLSDTMEEGKILKWLKHPGDRVAIGEIIAEVETDKANMELEAYDEGTLAEVRVQEGESAPVGAVIAVLAAPGEGSAARPAAGAEKAAKAAPAAPVAKAAPGTPRAAPAKAEAGREGFRPTVRRRPTAKRMGEAKREVPHFYASTEIAMDEAARLKEALAALEGEYEGLTYTHVVLKAVGLALTRVPELNASYLGDAMALHEAVNVGVATAGGGGPRGPGVPHRAPQA